MSLNTKIGFACSLLFLLAGCGGQASTEPDNAPAPLRLGAPAPVAATAVAVDYTTVVQQLYIAYFGRPADVAGLANFQNQLAAIGAPADLQKLEQAYNSNPAVKALIDSFGMSVESQTLYAGSNTAFIMSVYNNVLGRQPNPAGLAFWVGALDNGSLSRGKASISIMAGALANTTAQGLMDAALVQRKILIGSDFTKALIDMEISAYSGKTAAEKARQMLAGITAFTDATAFKTTVNTLASSLVAPTDNGKYICTAISHGLAEQLFLQGHRYLDRDSDGKPCEATDKYIEVYGYPVVTPAIPTTPTIPKPTTPTIPTPTTPTVPTIPAPVIPTIPTIPAPVIPTLPTLPVTSPTTGSKQCYVSGYTKKNGTYVKGYYRSC